MTDEEKKAIEDLKSNIEYARKCGREDTYTNQETIYVVLNLIEKQQEKIELLKDQKEFVLNEYGRTIEEKDKIIDEMAEDIVETNKSINEEYAVDENMMNKQYVKQYFERKINQ